MIIEIEYRKPQQRMPAAMMQRLLDINASHRSAELSRGRTQSIAHQAVAFVIRRWS